MTLRIATRASSLARWQADHVAELLARVRPERAVEIVPLSTEGDRRTDVPLAEIGGKGVFCKEVQRAVLAGEADVAVHSAKDLPALTTPGLVLAAVPRRGEPRDALVGAGTEELRRIAGTGRVPVVASGSARRRVQLAGLLGTVEFAELRGNMATRLDRAGSFDAIVVATVALQRLGLADRLTEVLPETVMVPQVGQGALAVECRAGDDETIALLGSIEDRPSRTAVDAERGFLAELGGDCSLPAGAHCRFTDAGTLRIDAVLASSVPPTGKVLTAGTDGGDSWSLARTTLQGTDATELGRSAARELRDRVTAR